MNFFTSFFLIQSMPAHIRSLCPRQQNKTFVIHAYTPFTPKQYLNNILTVVFFLSFVIQAIFIYDTLKKSSYDYSLKLSANL